MEQDLLTRPSLYEEDFVAWADQQAAALRARGAGANALDYDNLAEEIEGLSKSDRRKCESLTGRIIEHFIKLQFVPSPRDYPHWRGEIANFRKQLARVITPTIRRELVPQLPEIFAGEVETMRPRELLSDPDDVLALLGDGYDWTQVTDKTFFPEPLSLDVQPPRSSA